MIANCQRHRWDKSEDECRQCGEPFCENCLVYVNGADARPLCINCALKNSGVRGSKKVRPSRRERRATAKVNRMHERARAQADAAAAQAAAATAVDLAEVGRQNAGQRNWESVDASRWDAGTI